MSSLLIYCILLISYLQDGTCCKENQFVHEGNCCDMCPAGTYLEKYCGASTQTKCEICRKGTFTDQLHNLRICYPCQNCFGDGLITQKKCKLDSNSMCGCKAGYFCKESGFESCWNCQRYTPCPPGQGVKAPGTYAADTQCEECPAGTYSDKSSTTKKCKPFTES